MKLGLQVVAIFIAVLLLSSSVANTLINDVDNERDAPVPQTNGTSTLEVRPAAGDPEPLDFKLQGSTPGEQQAQGGLQNPQSADQLQPNARTNLFQGEE